METRSLDIGRALTYMFEEEEWVVKFLIAAGMVLLSFLILPAIILQGYTIEIIRRVGRNQRPQLPQWDAWAQYLSDGFTALAAGLVYALPAVLLTCCATFVIVGAGAANEGGELGGVEVLLLCCSLLLILLIEIPLGLIYYAGLVRFAESREIGAFFRFGQLFSFVRANLGQYSYALVVVIIASLVGSFVPILGNAWAQLVTGHALGQLLDLTRGGDPLPGGEMPLA